MDYFILTRKYKVQGTAGEVEAIGYLCVKDLARYTYDLTGKKGDFTFFSCSGVPQCIPTSEVLSITPSTPTYAQIEALK